MLSDWTRGDSLRRHARAVELVMRAAAPRYGEPGADVEAWGIAGMLHDPDYEAWPDERPRRIVAWPRQRGEDAIAHAVSAHYTRWGVPYDSRLDRALLACDEPTGFVMACCLVRPDDITSLEAASVKSGSRTSGSPRRSIAPRSRPAPSCSAWRSTPRVSPSGRALELDQLDALRRRDRVVIGDQS